MSNESVDMPNKETGNYMKDNWLLDETSGIRSYLAINLT